MGGLSAYTKKFFTNHIFLKPKAHKGLKTRNLKYQMKSLRTYFFCAFLAFSFASCKDNIQSSIPDFPVYLELHLTSTYPTFKNSNNEFLQFKTRENLPESNYIGYGGIIVCTGIGFDDSGNSMYYAFDMACPYEAKNTVRVYPEKTGLPQVVCEKCGSVYDISFGNGNPLSGPAKEFLKRYRTSLSGDILYVVR